MIIELTINSLKMLKISQSLEKLLISKEIRKNFRKKFQFFRIIPAVRNTRTKFEKSNKIKFRL